MRFKNLWTKLFTKNHQANEIALHISGATVRHRNPFEHIEVPRNNEELSEEFVDKWVIPFYMTSLSDVDEVTIKSFANSAAEINIEIVTTLLGDFNWRMRITGAFFAAINGYRELEEVIGKHLLKSEVCYAGSGYCLALAVFHGDNSKKYLTEYLNYYLERKDLWFDQDIAFCALEYIDKSEADKLLNKLNSFVADKQHWSLEKSRNHFRDYMATIDKIRGVNANP